MTSPALLATLALLATTPAAQEPFRVGLNMIRFDPAGTGSFDELDEILADADLAVWNSHGQDVIPTLFQVGGTSASMAGAPDHKALYTPDGELLDVGQPAIEAKVRGHVRVVAERYQDTVEHWEVANEVGGYSSYSADLYAALLVVVADELRAVDPANQVVVGGLAGTVAPVLSNHIAWFDQVLSAGAGDAIDVVNAHCG